MAGIDTEGIAWKQMAAEAGALEAMLTGMKLHTGVAPVQEYPRARLSSASQLRMLTRARAVEDFGAPDM